MSDWKKITQDGLWTNNPALVQLLGLCPLLAVSGSVVNALGLALATMLVLTGSNIAVSLARHQVNDAIRLPAFVMIIAAFTTCTELLMKAFTYELYTILGIFIPLIVTNCVILGRADAFASKTRPLPAAIDGIMMSLGFGVVLILIGAIRELVGTGQLFANMHLLFGEPARHWQLDVFGADYPGFLVAVLPPGAFLVAGLLIALKNMIDERIKNKAARIPQQKAASRRVRTTRQIN